MVNESLSGEVITENMWYLNTLLKELGTKTVVAFVILLIGFIVGRLFGKAVEKLLHELDLNRFLKSAAGIKISIEAVIGHGTSYLIYFISMMMALSQLGLATTVLNIISAALILLVVISVFLSVKDYIPNLLAGMSIMRKELFRQGDYIRVGKVEGKVIHTDLIETRIETRQKDVIYIPNSILVKNEVRKISRLSKRSSQEG